MSLKHILCIGTVTASIALPFVASAQQQDADAIRAKCIAEVRAQFPTNVQFENQVAGRQLYNNCMIKHGLTP
jgi:hypothetical protein